jgi:hypothetical protein
MKLRFISTEKKTEISEIISKEKIILVSPSIKIILFFPILSSAYFFLFLKDRYLAQGNKKHEKLRMPMSKSNKI